MPIHGNWHRVCGCCRHAFAKGFLKPFAYLPSSRPVVVHSMTALRPPRSATPASTCTTWTLWFE